MTRTGLAFAGHHVEVTYDDGAAPLIHFAWARHLSASRPDVEPAFMVRSIDGERVRFAEGGAAELELASHDALDLVIDRGTHLLAAGVRSGLLLHAAALARDDRAILCPGSSGAGKSTLAFWLAAAGYECLTDELARIDVEALTLTALARPLSFKPSGLRAIERSESFDGLRVVRAATGVFVETHPSSREAGDVTTLAALVFPRYLAGAPMRLREMTSAEAAMRVMETLVNAPSLPRHGLSEAARVARLVPAYELSSGDFREAAGRLEGLI